MKTIENLWGQRLDLNQATSKIRSRQPSANLPGTSLGERSRNRRRPSARCWHLQRRNLSEKPLVQTCSNYFKLTGAAVKSLKQNDGATETFRFCTIGPANKNLGIEAKQKPEFREALIPSISLGNSKSEVFRTFKKLNIYYHIIISYGDV